MDLFWPMICGAGALALIAGLVALVIVAGRSQARDEQRRQQRLHLWAARNRWVVTANPAVDWGARLPGGNRHGVAFAFSGAIGGYPVSVGEYSVTDMQISSAPDGTGGTTTTTTLQTHHFTVIVVRLTIPHPTVTVEPRGPLSKMGQAVFGSTPTATGNGQFDRRFRIQSPDPTAARRLVGPALADAHLTGIVPSWSLYGHELLAYTPGRLDDPERIPALAEPLVRVASLLGRW